MSCPLPSTSLYRSTHGRNQIRLATWQVTSLSRIASMTTGILFNVSTPAWTFFFARKMPRSSALIASSSAACFSLKARIGWSQTSRMSSFVLARAPATPPQEVWPQTTMCETLRWRTENSTALSRLRSVGFTTLPLTANSSLPLDSSRERHGAGRRAQLRSAEALFRDRRARRQGRQGVEVRRDLADDLEVPLPGEHVEGDRRFRRQ